MSYSPHLVVLAERASHARGSEEFRGTHGIRAECSAPTQGVRYARGPAGLQG